MRLEIPECTRCCVCIPLRYGIIIFGYLNLGFSIFLISLESYLRREDDLSSITMVLHRGVSLFSPVWFTLLLYILEIVLNFVLLVGAHWKKPQLMRVYYYYGITTTLAALVCFFLTYTQNTFDTMLYYYLLELCFVIGGVVMQVYLLLLIRSELAKLDQRVKLRFTNQASDMFVDSKLTEEIYF